MSSQELIFTKEQEEILNKFIEKQYINIDKAIALTNITKGALFDDSGCFSENAKASDINRSLELILELLNPTFETLLESRASANNLLQLD